MTKRKIVKVSKDDLVLRRYSKKVKLENKSVSDDEFFIASFEEQVLEIVMNGYPQELKSLLIRYPELVNTRDNKGNTILHLAAQRDDSLQTEYILKHYPKLIQTKNKDERTVLYPAVQANNTKNLVMLLGVVVKTNNLNLIKAQDEIGLTVLHLAAIADNTEAIAKLVESCFELGYIKNDDQETPLHLAARADCAQPLQILMAKYPQLINTRDIDGHNVWHSATSCNSTRVIELLKNQYSEHNQPDQKLTNFDADVAETNILGELAI